MRLLLLLHHHRNDFLPFFPIFITLLFKSTLADWTILVHCMRNDPDATFISPERKTKSTLGQTRKPLQDIRGKPAKNTFSLPTSMHPNVLFVHVSSFHSQKSASLQSFRIDFTISLGEFGRIQLDHIFRMSLGSFPTNSPILVQLSERNKMGTKKKNVHVPHW